MTPDEIDQELAEMTAQAQPETPEGELHPCQVAGYEPHFDRLGVTRRVLGHVTDEVDVDAVGPRNTLEALSYGLATDANTPLHGTSTEVAPEVQEHLDSLVEAGLLKVRKDGSYEVTAAGLTELRN